MKFIKVNNEGREVYVNVAQILYFAKDGNATLIYLNNGKDNALTNYLAVKESTLTLLDLIKKAN